MNSKWKQELPLHLLILPGVLLVFVYSYIPMLGIVIAFQKFIPALGVTDSKWIGLKNFEYLFALPSFGQVLWNTISIACMKIIAGLIVPITIAILLNEIIHEKFKRTVQTLIYLPHFLSWVVLGGILIDILSPGNGVVNQLLKWIGLDSIYFLGSNQWFKPTLVLSDVWKEFGFHTIVYLAAITTINPSLYEAAELDGASRLRKMCHITLPGMAPIIVLTMILSLGSVLNAGFDQVFNLYSPVVYQSGDILDTMVYRIGLVDSQFGVATALGLFKSVVSFLFISVSYWMAYRLANYRIF
jgi:putative aldouronate transport system permease protein